MVNFVVFEDNEEHKKRTKSIILNYMMKNKYEFDILYFDSLTKESEDFIRKHDGNNIYILDFELANNLTAIDVAREIRSCDWSSPIIVFTVNGGMALETFKQRLQILDFVSKQYGAEKNLHELFDICFDQLNIKSSFKYKIGKTNYSINYEKILYIYKDTVERKSIIVTDANEHPVALSLKKIKELLSDDFIFTHKACIVNKGRVNAYEWCKNRIVFDNGVITHFLSKTHKKELEKSDIF